MKNRNERGFSIIELLIVCVVIGVIVAIAIPALQKAYRVAENGNTYATLRTIASTEAGFYSQNNRYGRLSEINNILGGSIGTPSGTDINRGKYVLTMTPATPTDVELKDGYKITATRSIASEGVIYIYIVNQAGIDPPVSF